MLLKEEMNDKINRMSLTIRNMRKEIERLKKENADLTAQLEKDWKKEIIKK